MSDEQFAVLMTWVQGISKALNLIAYLLVFIAVVAGAFLVEYIISSQ